MNHKTQTKYKQTELGPIPEEWDVFKLEDLVEKIIDNRGKTPPITSSGYEIMEVNAIQEGRRTPDYEKITKFVDQYTYNTWFRTGHIKEGDVIIPTVGTIGNVAISLLDRASIAQNLIALRLNKKSNPSFIYYLLSSPQYKEKLFNLDIGGVQPSIKVPHLLNTEACLPPLNEQKQIAEILSSLDDKIELNRKMNKTLESIGQAIFKRWFVDFEFPNKQGNPYKSSGGEMVKSELGEIPKAWSVKKIKDIGITITDYVANGSFASLKENVSRIYEAPNYALFIRNTDLKNNFSTKRYVDKKAYDFLSKTHLTGGEVIISNVADVGSVYKCPYFKQHMVLGNNVIMLKSDKLNNYIYLLFISEIGQNLISSITTGSVQFKFNKTDFRNLQILMPNINLLEQFDTAYENTYKMTQANNRQIDQLMTIRDSLSPRLMSGKIRVKA